MKGLVTKTVGIHDVLLAALDPLKEKISLALVYGSTARLKENTQSDVDLMIVGKVHFSDVIEHLADAQRTLNREINPTVYSTREFGKKFRGNFLKTILSENKLFLIGDESVVRELGQK
jgi:predicted nucleotidyltransferase